jgi:hypothetical protein
MSIRGEAEAKCTLEFFAMSIMQGFLIVLEEALVKRHGTEGQASNEQDRDCSDDLTWLYQHDLRWLPELGRMLRGDIALFFGAPNYSVNWLLDSHHLSFESITRVRGNGITKVYTDLG